MKLVVGLGNPGKKYTLNKHNLGFIVLDRFVADKGLVFRKGEKCFITEYRKTLLMKSSTYMNNTGAAVRGVVRNNKVSEIMVVSDDINLPLGEIRLRDTGGTGGHNGLRSIIEHLGTGDFFRLRVGVGIDTDIELSEYVLSDFKKSELELLRKKIKFCMELIDVYIENDYQDVLNYYSKNIKSYSD